MSTAPLWKPDRKFWWCYALAWLPYLTGMFLVFFLEVNSRLISSVIGAGTIVLPLAIAGIALVAILARVPWDPKQKRRYFTQHVLLGIGFVFTTVVIIQLLYGVRQWLTQGEFSFSLLNAMVPFIVFNNFMIFCTLSALAYGLQLVTRLRQEEQRALEAEILKGKAELQAMRAQLNPHFLFNTLHSLQALIRTAPDRAEEALEQFGDLLRYPLMVQRRMVDEVSLEAEWGFVDTYLQLESLRLANRLEVVAELQPQTMPCLVPVFCLQPLVENAIKFSIEPKAQGGRVRIISKLNGTHLQLQVIDDGCDDQIREDNQGSGMGLNLLKRRLNALYGDGASIAVDRDPGTQHMVQLTLPLRGQA